MFIKKYEKKEKVYYMLVIVEQVRRQDKPHFINTFIPEKLAKLLSENGVEIKND